MICYSMLKVKRLKLYSSLQEWETLCLAMERHLLYETLTQCYLPPNYGEYASS